MLSFREFGALHENFTTARAKFIADGGDPATVDTSIAHFRKIQQKLTGDERDIDRWAVRGWTEFRDAMNFDFHLTNKDQITLRDDEKWLIIIPLNHYTSCFYGKSTPWCITKPNQEDFSFAFFREDGNIFVFCIEKKTRIMWALEIADHDGLDANIWNNKNETIQFDEFESHTGLSASALLATVQQNMSAIRAAAKRNAKFDIQHLVDQVRNTGKRDPRLEQAILKNKLASIAVKYIDYAHIENANDPFMKQATSLIATHSQAGGYFALYHLFRTRFPEYESNMLRQMQSLSKNPTRRKAYEDVVRDFVWYINKVVGEAFPAAEPYIAQFPAEAVSYVKATTHQRFPEAEEGIAQEPKLARSYALGLLNTAQLWDGPWTNWWKNNAPELWNKYKDTIVGTSRLTRASATD